MKKGETSVQVAFPGFQEVLERLERIENQIKSTQQEGIGGYVTEKEACKLLGKKTTWFWKLRKDGELPFTKVGSTVYYDKEDLKRLLDKGKN
ncbi:helix-turn-helix domain-containing protein [Catalinimonas niigatensis]|uniref:helix-turn-helix domain-containing protein n=1 Tax=Catalinimonas niigatensis TaxID=1397264 RepID=UPI00266519A8|nr:helix-turn-helix domain-containing protein [Catalinimonas niigatensis]WPP47961.1 helix-turn-helix domain-containing protein [Catalinimonas niigatensis]